MSRKEEGERRNSRAVLTPGLQAHRCPREALRALETPRHFTLCADQRWFSQGLAGGQDVGLCPTAQPWAHSGERGPQQDGESCPRERETAMEGTGHLSGRVGDA